MKANLDLEGRDFVFGKEFMVLLRYEGCFLISGIGGCNHIAQIDIFETFTLANFIIYNKETLVILRNREIK